MQNIFSKFFFIVFVSTFLFLLLFSGLYLFFDVNYSGYFEQNEYVWIGLPPNGKMPTTIEMLLSGFRNPINVFCCLIVSLAFSTLSSLSVHKSVKTRGLNILLAPFFDTILLTIIYFLYFFPYRKLDGYVNEFNQVWIKNLQEDISLNEAFLIICDYVPLVTLK
ncbi:hypothetical protein H7X65_03940 [Candidatus Parcubacteria bacterium]|nr:hypothetical protein [Candidatus Parcubacteria bacterium]